MPPNSVASAPSSPSTWQVHLFLWQHPHVWCSWEIHGYPKIRALAWKWDRRDMLTNSTSPAVHWHHPSPLDRPKILKYYRKIVQSQLKCQSCRRLRRTTVRSGAARRLVVEWWNGGTVKHTCVATYAREAVVTRVIPCIRALPDLVAFVSFSTELGEVKMCLYACPLPNKMYKSQTNGCSSPKPEADFWKDQSKALRGRTCGFHRPKAAIDRHRPLFRH